PLLLHCRSSSSPPKTTTSRLQGCTYMSRTRAAGTICLKVHASDSLSSVKRKIQEQYHLVFDGAKLEDDRTLADYNIEHGSTLDLQEKM
uniref:Ubiquitin-like domain-containing protein n=1 Tax=Aegilops tauschii subsp. strangulata TaxID=200361 RepID=A0A453GRV5_AEGTS